jgi:hypothetical protein
MPPITTNWPLRLLSMKHVGAADESGQRKERHHAATRAGVSTRPSRAGSSLWLPLWYRSAANRQAKAGPAVSEWILARANAPISLSVGSDVRYRDTPVGRSRSPSALTVVLAPTPARAVDADEHAGYLFHGGSLGGG